MGIEVYHMSEVIRQKMMMCAVAAALHSNECDAVFYGRSQPNLQIQIVQLLQKAACGHKLQVTKIIREVIRNSPLGGFDQGLSHIHGLNLFAIAVAQGFLYSILEPFMHLPQGYSLVDAAVGISQIEHIA